MVIQKTMKKILTNEDILKYIAENEQKQVPHMNELWEYYKGKDVKILNRKTPDSNNPDNKIVVSYGRKIINTFTGYAYRPKYITYKANIQKSQEQIEHDENEELPNILIDPIEKKYVNELQSIYNMNIEHIKTNRAGRNTGIFGCAYELLYIDSENIENTNGLKIVPRFFSVDPREMIVLYDYSPESKIVCAIRYFKTDNANTYRVEVYYKYYTDTFTRIRKDESSATWILINDNMGIPNLFNEVPVAVYYMGDEIQSIFENVLTLIDAHDVLFSDSLNEFDRFAFAYLIMKQVNLTNPIEKKDPIKSNNALKELKRRRVFEGLSKDAEISFLTKDIPTAFIEHIGRQLREQIHIQSHVPDFTGDKMAGASGIAIQRLMFDFENLVSSAEADFDVGLTMRANLVTSMLKKLNVVPKDSDFSSMVTINHKRNIPLNTLEFAQTALTMSSAGFSRRAIVGIMPEDIISNVEQELAEEKMEQEALTGYNNFDVQPIEEKLPEEELIE